LSICQTNGGTKLGLLPNLRHLLNVVPNEVCYLIPKLKEQLRDSQETSDDDIIESI